MNRVLLKRGLRDSAGMLVACCALIAGFIWFRGWVVSKIEFDSFTMFLTESLKAFTALLPVPVADLASPLGRIVFGFEEGPIVLVVGMWSIARGSEVIAGQQGAGTMEMLLAQPVRRISVVASHTAVTLLGAVALMLASWLGAGLGLLTIDMPEEPAWVAFWPAIMNLGALLVAVAGIATLASAIARTRTQAVGLVIGFYVIQLALMILGRLTTQYQWFEKLTILSAYEPTRLTLALAAEKPGAWASLVTCNAVLLALGAGCWALAATLFCRRDVPAPL